jgi:hypothetical protein
MSEHIAKSNFIAEMQIAVTATAFVLTSGQYHLYISKYIYNLRNGWHGVIIFGTGKMLRHCCNTFRSKFIPLEGTDGILVDFWAVPMQLNVQGVLDN